MKYIIYKNYFFKILFLQIFYEKNKVSLYYRVRDTISNNK